MTDNKQEIPARCGIATRVPAGNSIEVTNTHGHQVVDFWAFHDPDMQRYLSMQHTRAVLSKISPGEGDMLVDNLRKPFLRIEADTFGGLHDTIIPPCDKARYELLGCTDDHANCEDNLFIALQQMGMEPPLCPATLNLWMNIPVADDGSLQWLRPVSRPGDSIRIRALADAIVVMSACPQDILPINANKPVSAHFRLYRD